MGLLNRNHTHSVSAALIIISECIRYSHIEQCEFQVIILNYILISKIIIVSEVFSVQLVEKITLVFCSTHQLDVQEKVASLLLEITHQSMPYLLSTY